MDQTPEQLDWVKQNVDKLRQRGYDPERVELDPDGNIVEIPRYGYLETLARQGAKSILPTGASFAAGAAAAPFGAPLGPLGMAGAGLVGGLLGGGVTGFVQDKALDYIAPEFQEAARRSAEQNPKTAWLGDQATALATMKPNVRALANLSVLGKGAMNSPAMREALANAGINAGGALAGQGVNMLQGGDFEPGRFAADTVFGSIYTDPNKLGQRLGIKPSSDTTPLAKVKDLAFEQSEMQRARKGTPADADWAKLPPIQVEVASKAEEKLAASVRAKADKDYTKWWKSETIPTDKMFTEMMNESKLTISPENLAKLREMPEAIAAMKSPEAFKDFVWSSSEEALQEAYAYKKKQGELLGADEVPGAEKFRDTKLAGEMARGKEGAVKQRENQNWLDTENARFEAEQAREELESRMSRSDADAGKPLTQAELARMTQVAAKRGLTLTFEDLGNNRGQYVLATKDGQPLLKVNPLTATIDTIAHEVGHDVFNRSASEGMQKSLAETALGSDAYKRELAKRLEQGATQEQAHSIAAEEGLIDAFARAGNKTDASDVRAWFKAFKASIKHLAGSKLSPEDAVAWMHYATHNDTPWSGSKGRAAFTGSDERNQGGIEDGRYMTEAERFLSKGAPGLQRGRDGTIDPAAMKAWLSKQSKVEQELLKDVAFTKATPEDLAAMVRESGPKVEVVSYGMNGKVSEAKAEYARMGHDWYDTLSNNQKNEFIDAQSRANLSVDPVRLKTAGWSDSDIAQANKYLDLATTVRHEPKESGPKATSNYSTVSAFDTNEPMPSWTASKDGKNVQRVDVVLPRKMGSAAGEKIGNYTAVTDAQVPKDKVMWAQDDLHENLPNTLGWAMLQYKTGPNGEKIAVIAEAQSRWGQEKRTYNENIKDGKTPQEAAEGLQYRPGMDSPLDKDTNRLILKAAIDQARKEGATHIMLSDAETTMMTEKHDAKAHNKYEMANRGYRWDSEGVPYSKETIDAIHAGITPSEAKGMHLNYDTILPKITEEFTGSKGQRVSLGEHKNAVEYKPQSAYEQPYVIRYADGYSDYHRTQADAEAELRIQGTRRHGEGRIERNSNAQAQPRSNLIFRNADGSPKTDVSGRMYELKPVEKSFDPNVRDQGPSLGPLDSEQKKLSRVNPVVGEAFTSAFNTRDRTMGELSSKLAKVAALSETNKRELLKHLENESDSNTLVQPPAHLAEAYAQMRNEFIPEVPQMFNNAGFGIRTAKGFRAHGQNPTYMMLHHISPDVRETLTTKQGSPEYAGLKKDFIDWTRDYLIRAGMNPADATTQAVTKFEKEITEYNRKPDAAETLGFAGVRKPEGATLPPSWRSDDLMGNLSNYIKRSATDFASQTHIESSPEVMAALGAKKFGADKEIDPVILQATPNIVPHPVLQNVLRDYHGRMADNSTLADVGRVVSPLALGPISRSVDVMTTGLKGLAYLRPSEYVDGAINFAKGLTEWSALMSRSHQSGLNRLDTGANMRHVMGVGDANVNFMTRFASGLNKFTGLDKLESGARAIAQNWGETIVAMKRQQALAGDAKSVEFLDTLSKDWRSRDDLDLAAQVGRLLQGSYDTRQLPGWMLDGGLAPFLTWSKWSAGQLQAFNDFAVAPLFKGDVKPLVGQLLIGVLGGSVVQQVQEWMNNRQTRDVNWKELEAWADQNKGALGAPGSTLLASKLLTLSQRMGTFGFAGDLVKGVVEAAAGQNPQGVLHNPAIEGIFNTSKYGAAAIAAISSGEDVGAVLGKLTKDLAVNNSQVVRAARNWVDTDENLAYNDRRRQNLFNFLRGEGAGANTFAVSYKDLAEKEFDKTKEPADMVAQAGKLLERAATDATSQEDFVARLRKLGTSQNSVMPNPKRQPDKAFKYLKWVHDAEGADESSSTQRRWQEEDARAKYRKSLVSPGSSGAR